MQVDVRGAPAARSSEAASQPPRQAGLEAQCLCTLLSADISRSVGYPALSPPTSDPQGCRVIAGSKSGMLEVHLCRFGVCLFGSRLRPYSLRSP